MTPAQRNISLYPWFKFFQNLNFWQATWFLYFQQALSPAEAIVLYVIYDIATTVIEVPSGYASDRFGRKITLTLSALCGLFGAALLLLGSSFSVFALGQLLLGAGMAFSSGTDSALLYESLAKENRANETEAQELHAWRHTFTALAVSAVTGGALAYADPRLPFAAAVLAALAMLTVTYRFTDIHAGISAERTRFSELCSAFRAPVLLWLFAFATLMHSYNHLPFVFGQPFIETALSKLGLAAEAPLVSGAVSTTMMLFSVAVSFYALTLRKRLGLTATLLLAFALQTALAATLALTGQAWAIAVLLLRMVPSSFSFPFITARVQPLLGDAVRASYLSVQSLAGRLFFAVTLWLASLRASGDTLEHAAIRDILGSYTLFGLLSLATLALLARRLPIDDTPPRP